MRNRWGASLALGAWLMSGHAEAYCRTSTCKTCERDADTGCVAGGIPVAWPSSCVSFSVQELGSEWADVETTTRLMNDAFAVWMGADCGGAPPSIEVGITDDLVSCEDVGHSTRSGNANVVVYRDQEWPYQDQTRSLASTTVTSRSDGAIVDADIEINSTLPLFIAGERDAGGIVGAHDLLSIMVHESGHFLGLDHSRDDLAIMWASLDPGEVRVVLSDDDIAGICAAYPPEREAACDNEPQNGFSASCPPSVDSGCSVQSGRSPLGDVSSFAFVCGFVWFARRRRRTAAPI